MGGFLFSAAKSRRKPSSEILQGTCFGILYLDTIDARQQPTKLSADDRGIAEGTDAGDVDVDRRATVRTRLRGDRPRLTGRHRRRTLENPVFRPIPAIGVAPDDSRSRTEVVVSGVGIEANGYGVEATVGKGAGDYRAGEAEPVEQVAPAARPVTTDLCLLLFPDHGRHHALAQ